MMAVCASLAPGTQWSHIPMLRLPAARALRTKGAATRPAATPPATTPRRDNLLDGMRFVLPEGTVAHTNERLLFCFGTDARACSDGWRVRKTDQRRELSPRLELAPDGRPGCGN